MKNTVAEFSCIALLWVGAAGIVASMFISGAQPGRIQSLCEFSAVVAVGCIAKMLLSRARYPQMARQT